MTNPLPAMPLDPDLSPEALAELAASDPNSWPQVLAHPNCYPGLAGWIRDRLAASDVPVTQGTSPVQMPGGGIIPGEQNGGSPKSGKATLSAIIAGTLAMVAIGGAAFWWFTKMDDVALETQYIGVPSVTTSVVLPPNLADQNLRIARIKKPVLRSGQFSIVALHAQDAEADPRTTFVAFRDGVTSYPNWVVEVDSLDPQCSIAGDHFDCGGADVFDLQTGWPQSSESVTSSTGTGTHDSETSSVNAGIGTAAAGSDPNGDTDEDAEATNNESSGSENNTEVSPNAPITVKVPESASEEIPFAFVGAALQTADGHVIDTFTGGTLWALSDSESGGSFWVFTDGKKMIAVKGTKIQWTVDLPEGTVEVSGFNTDSPTWTVDGSVVIVGAHDQVIGYSVDTGTQDWVLEAPDLTSWMADHGALYLAQNDVIYEAEFGSGAEKLVDPQSGVPTVLAASLANEDFENGTFQLPAGCVEWTTWAPEDFGVTSAEELVSRQFVLTGGRIEDPLDYGRAVVFDDSTPLYADGNAYTLASFWCENGGMYPFQFFGIYDAEGNLVADSYEEPGLQVGGYAPHLGLVDLNSYGSTLTYDLVGIGIAGDEGCGGCVTSGTATVTGGWDGQKLWPLDILYHLPYGDARTPNLTEVQEAYDAVVDGDLDKAGEYFTPEAMADIREGTWCPYTDCMTPEEELSVAAYLFPEGAHVEECVLASSFSTVAQGLQFGQGQSSSSSAFKGQWMHTLGTSPPANGNRTDAEHNATPGVFFCGLTTDENDDGFVSPETLPGDDKPHYTLWLAAQSDSSGKPSDMTLFEDISRNWASPRPDYAS